MGDGLSDSTARRDDLCRDRESKQHNFVVDQDETYCNRPGCYGRPSDARKPCPVPLSEKMKPMAHHHEGPTETCARCGESFRDNHECYGRPVQALEYFIAAHGMDQVAKWIKEIGIRKAEEERVREALLRRKLREELEQKIKEGEEAKRQLEQLRIKNNH